jgi:hypothetical protein
VKAGQILEHGTARKLLKADLHPTIVDRQVGQAQVFDLIGQFLSPVEGFL